MSNFIRLILAVIALITTIAITGVPSSNQSPITFAQVYYGYLAKTTSPSYQLGQTVTFSLQDNTRTPMLQSPLWEIVDSDGNIVYISAPGDDTASPVYTVTAAWDQKDQNGQPVSPGIYTIVFPQTPNKANTDFTILPAGVKPIPDNKKKGRDFRKESATVVHI